MSKLYCHFLAVLRHFLHCPCDLSMEYFESPSFTVSIIGVIASLVLLILPWFPKCFLHVLNEILSLLGYFNLSTIVSFKGGSSSPPLNISSFLFSYQKYENFVSSGS